MIYHCRVHKKTFESKEEFINHVLTEYHEEFDISAS